MFHKDDRFIEGLADAGVAFITPNRHDFGNSWIKFAGKNFTSHLGAMPQFLSTGIPHPYLLGERVFTSRGVTEAEFIDWQLYMNHTLYKIYGLHWINIFEENGGFTPQNFQGLLEAIAKSKVEIRGNKNILNPVIFSYFNQSGKYRDLNSFLDKYPFLQEPIKGPRLFTLVDQSRTLKTIFYSIEDPKTGDSLPYRGKAKVAIFFKDGSIQVNDLEINGIAELDLTKLDKPFDQVQRIRTILIGETFAGAHDDIVFK